VDVILSAEDPLFCPNLGGCRGGNLGPVWDYTANVGVPSGCSPGQNAQPSGVGPNQSSGLMPQTMASWVRQAAATPGGCCYPVARRTMESNNPTCLQAPCPGGTCPLKKPIAAGGDPGIGNCVDWWGNVTTNTSLKWNHYRTVPNSTHGMANNTEMMRAIFSDGSISTGIWLCGGDEKPANKSSHVFKGALTKYPGGVYDCQMYNCGFAFHAVTIIGWGHDPASNLDYWTVRNSWGDGWGEDHLNPTANCSRGECGYFRITRDYKDSLGRTHSSCQMNQHALAGLPVIPGSCQACATQPEDYCQCWGVHYSSWQGGPLRTERCSVRSVLRRRGAG
jgi:hypothetical protein